MELAELTAYAKEKYQMEEMHKWADFPGFSVLCHPRTGQWTALLMRQWDSDSGMTIERCDLKCGARSLRDCRKPYLSSPIRMQGSKWLGISFGRETEAEVVFALFDRAVAMGNGNYYLGSEATALKDGITKSGDGNIVLDNSSVSSEMAGKRTVVRGEMAAIPDKGAAVPGERTAVSGKGNVFAGMRGILPGAVVFGQANTQDRQQKLNMSITADKRADLGAYNKTNGKTRDDINVKPYDRSNHSAGITSGIYRDTVLPRPPKRYSQKEAAIPERIHEMLRLYEYGRESMEARARNFYRQAVFMQDYEDDYPWSGSFEHYYPTYHDMTARQLRGYFSWRTQVRRGEYREIPASAACVYIFEILNGIGVKSPLDGLLKMKEFEKAYVHYKSSGQGLFSAKLKRYLSQWMHDYCVVKRIPSEIAMDYLPQDEVERNAALIALKNPENARDEDIFKSLCGISNSTFLKSTAFKKDRGRTVRIVAESWRKAVSHYAASGNDLFTLCFGRRVTRHWYPFSNAVYYWSADAYPEKTFSYEINGCLYRCKDDSWKVSSFESICFDLKRIKNFLHEADSQIRSYIKSGRYLTGKPEGEWATPYIKAAIEDDRRAAEEAAKPKITIDMSGIDRIRREAIAIRDSLLTEEELYELEDINNEAIIVKGPDIEKEVNIDKEPDINKEIHKGLDKEAEIEADREAARDGDAHTGQIDGLSPIYTDILRILLGGGSPDALIREKHLMPSIVADAINDALFDEIGDIVVACEDDRLSLVEDYKEELTDLSLQ